MTDSRAEDRLADRVIGFSLGSIRRVPARIWTVAYGVVLIGLFGILAYSLRSQWFILDEFDYFQAPNGSWIAWLITPHNEHTIVFTKLWYSTLFELFGMRHYWIYALPMLIAHLFGYAAVVRIVRFATGSVWFARLASLPLLVMAAGSGTLLWGGQFQYTGAVAAGLWLLWFSIRPERPKWWTVALLAIVGTFSGSAFIAFGVVAAATFLIRRRVVPGVISIAIPAVWFVVERAVWHVSDVYQAHGLGQFFGSSPAFVFALLDRAVLDTTRTPSMTAAILVAVILGAIAAARRGWTRESRVAAVLAAAAGMSLFVTVIGRLGRDTADAASGGYSYFIVILAFPALIILLKALLPARSTLVFVTIGCVFLTGVGVAGFISTATSYATWRQGTERTLEGAAFQIAHGRTGVAPDAVPDPGGSPSVTWKRLTAWQQAGAIDLRRPDASTSQELSLAVAVTVTTTTEACSVENITSSLQNSTRLPTARAILSPVGASSASVSLFLMEGGPSRSITIPSGQSVVADYAELRVRVSVSEGAVRVCAAR